MELKLKSKLPEVGPNIFGSMSKLAAEYNAINLSQGYPDFDPPEELKEWVRQSLTGKNQYAPNPGVGSLREHLAKKIKRMYGLTVDAEQEITVTSGATEALFLTIQTVVHPGDEVIIFDPSFDSYDPAVKLAGGKPVRLPLQFPDFRIDWNLVESHINDKTRLILLNNPHNPTGTMLSSEDLRILEELTRNKNIFILSDEVYEHIIFDGRQHESVLRYPELYQRSFVLSSLGKTCHATGWKIGYCVAPPAFSEEIRKFHQIVTFSVSSPMQYALAEFLEKNPGHYSELPTFYQEKRDFFCKLLENSRFQVSPAEGTYFQMVQYGEISAKGDQDFVRELTCEKGVAAIPVSVFYEDKTDHHLIRFCFAKNPETLEKAAKILCEL